MDLPILNAGTCADAGKTSLVVIQPSSFCNIDCKYCYVPGRSNRAVMEASLLEEILTKVFDSERIADGFRLVWHNGEPLALGIDFYRKAIELISRTNRRGKPFHHCIQTNGTLIDQAWVDFFAENQIAPTVSIDGPRHIHDIHRVTRSGHGSFDATMRGVRVLRENKVRLVGLCVVTATSLSHGKDLFHFFLEEGFCSLGLIIEEPWGGSPGTTFTRAADQSSVAALEQKYRSFVGDFFDAWFPHRHEVEVREFNDLFSAFRKVKLDQSAFAQQEDNSPCAVLSFNQHGGVTTFSPQMIAGTHDSPDRFIVANIRDLSSLDAIEHSPIHQRMVEEINSGIRRCREECGYFSLCGGGAPASKFYERGTFDCTETRECRYSKQLLADVLLTKSVELIPRRSLGPQRDSEVFDKPVCRIHSQCINGTRYVWDVENLWEQAATLEPKSIRIDSISEVNQDCWFSDARPPSIRNVADHARRISEADLAHPIILNADGCLMDGGHRLAKAIIEGREEILAVQFEKTPVPDRIEKEC